MTRRTAHLAELVRRLTAAGSIALVLLLATLSASPELHQLLHGADHGGPDDGCAVVQFAQGVSVTPDTAVVAAVPVRWLELARPEVAERILTAPRSLLPPGRGPPTS